MKMTPRADAEARKAKARKRVALAEAELAAAQAEWARANRDVGREVVHDRERSRERDIEMRYKLEAQDAADASREEYFARRFA